MAARSTPPKLSQNHNRAITNYDEISPQSGIGFGPVKSTERICGSCIRENHDATGIGVGNERSPIDEIARHLHDIVAAGDAKDLDLKSVRTEVERTQSSRGIEVHECA